MLLDSVFEGVGFDLRFSIGTSTILGPKSVLLLYIVNWIGLVKRVFVLAASHLISCYIFPHGIEDIIPCVR